MIFQGGGSGPPVPPLDPFMQLSQNDGLRILRGHML